MVNRIVVVVSIAVAVTAMSFAFGQTDPGHSSSATDAAVVKELRALNRKVQRLNRSIGKPGAAGKTAIGLLQDICEMTRDRPEFSAACNP